MEAFRICALHLDILRKPPVTLTNLARLGVEWNRSGVINGRIELVKDDLTQTQVVRKILSTNAWLQSPDEWASVFFDRTVIYEQFDASSPVTFAFWIDDVFSRVLERMPELKAYLLRCFEVRMEYVLAEILSRSYGMRIEIEAFLYRNGLTVPVILPPNNNTLPPLPAFEAPKKRTFSQLPDQGALQSDARKLAKRHHAVLPATSQLAVLLTKRYIQSIPPPPPAFIPVAPKPPAPTYTPVPPASAPPVPLAPLTQVDLLTQIDPLTPVDLLTQVTLLTPGTLVTQVTTKPIPSVTPVATTKPPTPVAIPNPTALLKASGITTSNPPTVKPAQAQPLQIGTSFDDIQATFAKYAEPYDLTGITKEEYAALDKTFNSMSRSNVNLTRGILSYLQESIKALRAEFDELKQIT